MIRDYDTHGMHLFHFRSMARWAGLWRVPGLEQRVSVVFSRRMRRALGRCLPSRGWIRLNAPLLIPRPDLLTEVLCHELAHAAVFELHGERCRPHGREWSDLMHRAGYRPRTQLKVEPLCPSRERGAADRIAVFDHICLVCDAARTSPRPWHRWRCSACVSAGREGRLTIRVREAREA